jgi:hypothetical protein
MHRANDACVGPRVHLPVERIHEACDRGLAAYRFEMR